MQEKSCSTDVVNSGKAGSMAIFMSSLLVLGNVMGIGLLALPVASGLGGYVPALIGISSIWLVMLFSAWLIVYRMDSNQHHDMPSFYKRELGTSAKWLAIVCNLIILYGILVAYLSGISTMISSLVTCLADYKSLVMLAYFCIGVCLIGFGIKFLKRSIVVVVAVIWASFFIMMLSGTEHVQSKLLTYASWSYLPVCLPLAVSAFHFHNIIPTVSKSLNFDKEATCKAIFIGVLAGLVINILWMTVVLGTLPEAGKGSDTVVYANAHNLAANVPLAHLLHNKLFTVCGLVFGIFAITSSFMTNGVGLWGYIDDILYTYFKKNHPTIVSAVSFLPVITVALIYPNIFITAVSIVGGIGEDILFGILPAIVILKVSKGMVKHRLHLQAVGIYMFFLSLFVLCYVIYQKEVLLF